MLYSDRTLPASARLIQIRGWLRSVAADLQCRSPVGPEMIHIRRTADGGGAHGGSPGSEDRRLPTTPDTAPQSQLAV